MLHQQFRQGIIEGGCDEAGRGCLAGPVVAACVILDPGCEIKGLRDSKKIPEKERLILRDKILKYSLSWHVASTCNELIDQHNILNASILSMHKAVEGLGVTPELLLIDGNRFKPYPDIPHVCIVKGDAHYASIAAASILAKTHRDELMRWYNMLYPGYHWDINKGYPTPNHKLAIEALGFTPIHRRSFQIKPKQLRLFS
ncbi:MAG: ribonuclease HII [Chitinophagia bacterium]|nr:ribonuclease HII [Chitinophagia bacterium]